MEKDEDKLFNGPTIKDLERKWAIKLDHLIYPELTDEDNIYAIVKSMQMVRETINYLVTQKNVEKSHISVDNFGA